MFGRTVLKGRASPMVLELPSYKVPSLTNALLSAKHQGLAFLRTAGTIIMAICVVMWRLEHVPSRRAAGRSRGAAHTGRGARPCSWKYPALQLAYMSGLAYVAALIVYQGLRAVGVS